MADEANIPTHRWYQNRNHIKLPMQDVSESVIKAAGIAKIDQFMITAASDALFVAGEVGVWYDPSDLTTLFQDSAGTTPVTAAGQPVGLMLDKSKGLSLGSELVSNGDFSNGVTGWSPQYSSLISVVAGELQMTAGAAGTQRFSQPITCVIGKTYKITATARQGTTTAGIIFAASINANLNSAVASSASITSTANTTVSFYFVATATTMYVGGNDTNATIGSTSFFDNISVKDLAGNHATQATAAQRPIYGFHPYSGVRNLLLATDTMATQSRTVTAVPHTLSFTGTGTITLTGASTAGPLVGTGAGNRVSLTFTPIAGSLTLTVVGSVTFVQLEIGATATAYQTVTTQYNITEAGVPSVSYLAFDGVDDGMVTSAINFSATNKMTVFVGLRKLSDATQGVVAELTQFVGSFAGSFTVFAPATGTAANYGWRCRGNGTVPIVNSPTTFAAPDTAVFTGIGDISGDIATLRIDGVQVATDTTTDQGTGNFANDILYIGRRGGASLPFNGNLYSLIVRGAQSTDSQITSTETWVNGKTGAF